MTEPEPELPTVVYLPGDEMRDGTVVPIDSEPVEVVQTWPTSEPAPGP
jgi:hypothetical protein